MIDYGHICLLVFTQGPWKENYKEQLLKEISDSFISNMNLDDIDRWSETEMISLFHPKNPGDYGKPCEVCHALYEIFEEKKGNNDELILFSHNILSWEGTGKFILSILGEIKVKKIYYLELDQFSYLLSANKKIPEIINDITHVKINRTEFFKFLDEKKLNFSTLYDVSKY